MTDRRLLAVLIGFLVAGTGLSQSSRRLDKTSFVVIGEGLAAGVTNFSLSEPGQKANFGALAARQMGTIFPQPIFQTPGIGNVVGFNELPLRIPTTLQTTFRKPFPPQLFVFNLSVPGFHLADATARRPVSPLIQPHDPKQTMVNFILGYPQLILEDDVPLWTQLEYAVAMRPTLVVVELGYAEVLEAAVKGNLGLLPSLAAMRSGYDQLLGTLRGTFAEVVIMTVPDPLDTAYFTDPVTASRLLRVPPFTVLGLYGLDLDDLITTPGLVEMGNQFLARKIDPLPSGSFLPAATAAEITDYVNQLNSEIRASASQHKAVVHDLHALMRSWKISGAAAGSRQLSADFLGGLYTLNGYYPGPTGHGLIANSLLDLLNQTYGTQFPAVNLAALVSTDPVADFRAAEGEETTLEELAEFVPEPQMRQVLRARSRLTGDRGTGREPRTQREVTRPERGRP